MRLACSSVFTLFFSLMGCSWRIAASLCLACHQSAALLPLAEESGRILPPAVFGHFCLALRPSDSDNLDLQEKRAVLL